MESQNTPPSVDENAWFDQGMILDYFQNLQEENTQLRKELMATKAQEDLNIMERYNEINDLNTAQRQLQAEIAETEKLKKTIERSLWTPQIPDIELKKEDGVSDHEYRTVIKHMGELLGRFGEIERQFYEIKKGFHDTTKDLADNLALISKEYFAVYQRLEQVESSKAVTAAVTDAALAELQSGTAALMLNEDGYFSRIMRLKLTPPGIIEVFDETMYRNYVYIDCNRISTIETFEDIMNKAWPADVVSVWPPIKCFPRPSIQWPHDVSSVKHLALKPCGPFSNDPKNNFYEITSIVYRTEETEDVLSSFDIQGTR
ncbi:Protein of unknown function [Pyronema omphalodes CBS 100304]|uniref:Uncharacterized protein n=1 Tax=Pyronema omphalodes (strain CBS 100304) TaxID=1076935 RepID=U4L1F2_PYROM|nr:Protein of unknown function [Pyronema omphalodes CBS 100304]